MVFLQTEMESVEELAKLISRTIPNIPIGSLRFWGAWFGRPHDAFHRIVKGESEQGVLRLTFDEGEILSVWAPRGVTVNQLTFRISDCDRVRWEWFYYGKPKGPENLRFLDYLRVDNRIEVSANFELRFSEFQFPEFRPSATRPAVEIVPTLA